jgi:succinate dehydrogenase / fumarate reductase membrane anchor subunit
MAPKHTRSPFGHAIGLGSAKEGVEHWWRERVTAVALVPLTVWWIASVIAHSGADYAVSISWLRMPLTALLMALMLIALFYHAALGLQVIIEDYVHSAAKLPAILLIRFACFGLAAAGILAVLRIALGSFR